MYKALLSSVCDEDITEPNCSKYYLKNKNTPISVVYDEVSAGETLILNSNVHSKVRKIPDSSTNLRDVYQVKGKIFHDNAFMNKALLSSVCDEDITKPNRSKNYLKNNNTPNTVTSHIFTHL